MPFILLLLIFTTHNGNLFLAADLKKGKHILAHAHGIGLNKEDTPYKLNVFDKYASMNLAGFAFSKKKNGKHTISLWKQKGKRRLEIYQVETILHVDTAVTTYLYIDTPSKQKKEKTSINSDFNYRTYIIYDGKQPTLIYTIDTKGYLLEYRIGKHTIQPYYEDVAIGQELPDINAIVRLLNKR